MTRAALVLTWPVLLGAWVYLAFLRLGFNPTDEGFVNAASYRVLSGQWPHSDWIWPRPAGSAYLHVPELLLPTPMIMTSRAIALGELIGYSLLFAVLVTGRSPRRWSLTEAVGVALSVLVSLNSAAIRSWYTIDGLLLVAIGVLVLQSALRGGRRRQLAVAFLVLGGATLTKQSFWPAPVLGLIWLAAVSPRQALVGRLAIALAATAALPLLYIMMVWLSGGVPAMIQQLASARPVVGIELVTDVPHKPLVAILGIVVAGLTLARPPPIAAIRLLPPAIVTLICAAVIVSFGLLRDEGWSTILWWLVVVRVAVDGVRRQQVDWPGMVLIGVGWMVSLSWGLSVPDLVGGSLVLFLIHRAMQDAAVDARTYQRGALALAVLLAAFVVPTFVAARTETIYRERPAGELTASLDVVDDDFAGVSSNPVTADYLIEVRDCINAHPARRVAILPDNAALYPTLGLANPFPIDWMIPAEMVGSEARVVEAAAALDVVGDYLVIFQSVPADRLAKVDSLEPGVEAFRDPQLGRDIRRHLTGSTISCGNLEAVWSP